MKFECPNCKNSSFYGMKHLIISIIIDEDGEEKYDHGGNLNDCVEEWLKTNGPYKCTECHHEYEELPKCPIDRNS